MPFYFKATHSDGRVALRKSASTSSYAWAVMDHAGSIQCRTYRDSAQMEANRLISLGHNHVEVVPLVAIDSREYNATMNASKNKYTVKFQGKTYTKTCSVDSVHQVVGAIGVVRDAGTRDNGWGISYEAKAEQFVLWYYEGYSRQGRDEMAKVLAGNNIGVQYVVGKDLVSVVEKLEVVA